MGLMDAFGAETRVEITVRELTALLKGKAKAEADFNAAMVMLREGVDPETVRAVFGLEKEKRARHSGNCGRLSIVKRRK